MPSDAASRVVARLAERGYNATPAAVTRIARAPDPDAALDEAVAAAPPDTVRLDCDVLPEELRSAQSAAPPHETKGGSQPVVAETGPESTTGDPPRRSTAGDRSGAAGGTATTGAGESGIAAQTGSGAPDQPRSGRVATDAAATVEITGDVTGRSTGTGTYDDFVAVFRDRLERLSEILRSRVTQRPAAAIATQAGGTETAAIGLIADTRTTRNGHTLVELEDTTGTVPCLIHSEREFASVADTLLHDEAIAVEGTVADDEDELVFVDRLHHPDVPQTYSPTTADRPVQAALVSDLHVGSREFCDAAWDRFVEWLHTADAERVEYLLIAGDMVEGIGVYPDQDEELDVIDVYEQYDRFCDRIDPLPDRLEVVMIPGNHDAVRLAEPQPGFDPDLRERLTRTDARVVGNPAWVTIEGVQFLLYHGVSLDEVIAAIPDAAYDDPTGAMTHLLRKRHCAPRYGGRTRLAPEAHDYLVMDAVPDVFHAGHVHKTGAGVYNGVRVINSGCWQEQTAYQRSVNIDPDPARAAIVDLDTLDVTLRRFGRD